MDDTDTSEDDNEDEDELTMYEKVTWKKHKVGRHKRVKYDGPIGDEASSYRKKYGCANAHFFPEFPHPVQCFFQFLPIKISLTMLHIGQIRTYVGRKYVV